MRDLQPEIAKIKKKTKGDKTQESKMMMELFKEKEVNPFGALGLALLQFPILIALFFVLRDIVDPAQINETVYGFVSGFDAVKDIINNPADFHPTLFGIIDMAKPSVVLAVLAGFAQYLQARQLTPKDTSKSDPSARLGFQMTLIFPVLTVIIGLQLPSALALYWMVSSLVAILQQHIVLAEDVNFMQRLLNRGNTDEPKTRWVY